MREEEEEEGEERKWGVARQCDLMKAETGVFCEAHSVQHSCCHCETLGCEEMLSSCGRKGGSDGQAGWHFAAGVTFACSHEDDVQEQAGAHVLS